MASLAEKRLFLLDMDGTLYLDDFLFDKVPEFLSLIRRQGGRYLFLTNNSSRGVEGYIDKMRRLGIETTPEDYLTSADAAQHTLLTEFPGQRCYVSGTASLKAQLAGAGVPITDALSDDIAVLLSGFDTELTFQKLEDSLHSPKPGCHLAGHQSGLGVPHVVRLGAGLRQRVRNADTGHGAEAPLFMGKPQPEMVHAGAAAHRL